MSFDFFLTSIYEILFIRYQSDFHVGEKKNMCLKWLKVIFVITLIADGNLKQILCSMQF